jgi:hypothetical protein
MYVLMSRHQNAGQNHSINTANESLENAAHFKYLEMTAENNIFFSGKN